MTLDALLLLPLLPNPNSKYQMRNRKKKSQPGGGKVSATPSHVQPLIFSSLVATNWGFFFFFCAGECVPRHVAYTSLCVRACVRRGSVAVSDGMSLSPRRAGSVRPGTDAHAHWKKVGLIRAS